VIGHIVNILFDILTYGIFFYSTLLLLSYIFIGLFSIGETRKYMNKNKFTDYRVLAASVHAPSVSILAPAYNEGLTIVENVRSLLSIYYSNLEVIVINDGSKDDCLQKMIHAYDLEKIDFFVDYKIETKPVRGVYKSRKSIYHKLIVVDKVNGGKADALNVGINISSNKYLVCIDVDCILEQDALLKMVKPFMEQNGKERVIASGGVVRIANSCEIEDGRLVKVRLAKDYLPRMQILEYIRAFILGRMAWSRLNGLMLISGAFGAFDKDIAIKAGGYNHNTVGEDMELVVRMRRYMEERNEKYRVTYIPDPLCWTEAPNSFDILSRQRNRWTRGTIETLKFHKIMFFNPKYGLLGMLSYPYWFFFEMVAPLIEFFGFICFLVFASLGLMDWSFFFTYLLFIVCFGYLYSAFAILMEVITYNQYKRRTDMLVLLLTALTEPLYFHPFVVWSAIKGYIDYLRKKKSWGEMTRQGFAKKTDTPAMPVETPAAQVVVEPVPQPVVVTPVVEEVEENKAPWFRRTIIPWLQAIPQKIFHSIRYFVGHAAVLLLLMLLARVFEVVYDFVKHGRPAVLNKVFLYGFAKDVAFFSQLCTWFIVPFTLLYLLHKKIAHVFFILIALVLVLTQVSLSEYFITTLVPLGADLWSYSWADIMQTVNAAGGVSIGMIIGFVVLIALVITALILWPKRLQPDNGITVGLLLLLFIANAAHMTGVTERLLPGQEYSNNLSVNKSYFFLNASYHHFFPSREEKDIYSDTYASDFSGNGSDGSAFARHKFVDEQNYPFLHTIDSTADVLSPFFRKTDTMPNVVILVVEGLGRAFTNKGAYLGNFTPFIDSLAEQSLYWQNFLSEGGRTFAALPSLLGSLPFARNGFNELGAAMPKHLSLLNILKNNGYSSSFYYGGDSHFDNMDMYLRRNSIDAIYDEKTYPAGYIKMPSVAGAATWGYGDKELFRHYFEVNRQPNQPYVNIVLTVSTHSPFLINDQQTYLQRFEQRMTELNFDENKKRNYRNYKYQYASILFTNDAVRSFIEQYRQRPDFANTVFVITGDHRMPEIPMTTKIDRYHVPLIIYSPLLKRKAQFASVSTHFDITPTLLTWLKKDHQIRLPTMAAWIGTGIDTSRQFRNIHAYPLMQTKTDIVDFVMGDYMINGSDLYRISSSMGADLTQNDAKAGQLRGAFNRFRQKNGLFLRSLKLVPDSLLSKYAAK
jgi:cellulose synthase/poly-beta-1,6-N-acetylglucosamine synthase-like glycosyltransferase/phosphoglycerol transferase MdoB-like AlkP superfamily enzyme